VVSPPSVAPLPAAGRGVGGLGWPGATEARGRPHQPLPRLGYTPPRRGEGGHFGSLSRCPPARAAVGRRVSPLPAPGRGAGGLGPSVAPLPAAGRGVGGLGWWRAPWQGLPPKMDIYSRGHFFARARPRCTAEAQRALRRWGLRAPGRPAPWRDPAIPKIYTRKNPGVRCVPAVNTRKPGAVNIRRRACFPRTFVLQ
jgi:hypothetical protein